MQKKLVSLIIVSAVLSFTTSSLFPSKMCAEGKDVAEIVSLRSEYGKQFANDDGTITSYINTVPIHYFEDNEWKEIDNTLIKDKNGDYTNKSNSYNIHLPSSMTVDDTEKKPEDSIDIEYKGHQISLLLNDTSISSKEGKPDEKTEIELIDTPTCKYPIKSMPKIVSDAFSRTDSTVCYESLFSNNDLFVNIQSQAICESISFKSAEDIPEQISYYIDAKGLFLEKNENNGLKFVDESGEVIFEVPEIVMSDSSLDSRCYTVPFEITEENDEYLLTLSTGINSSETTDYTYPLSLDMLYSIYPTVSTRYNSQAYPNSVYYDNYMKISGVNNNKYETYVSVNDSFASYGNTAIILEADFYMYFPQVDMQYSSAGIELYSVQTEPMNISWNEADHSTSNNTFISSIYMTNSFSSGWKWADMKILAQAWLNYANTSQWMIGLPNYGFKIRSLDNATFIAFSERAAINKPFFVFRYEESDDYFNVYAPYKYNDFGGALTGKINNFQNRMNCYAYALQMYYRGSDASTCYLLYPGEIGLNQQDPSYQYTDITNFGELVQGYSNCSGNTLLQFTDEQMRKDAQAIGYNITNLSYGSNACISDEDSWLDYVQNDFDESEGRIIVLCAGQNDIHYFLRDGDGTCDNPNHAANCSTWSHKPGYGAVTEGYCDETIYYGSKSYNDWQYYCGPWFYNIDKTTCVYNTWFYYGHNSNSTGTSFVCLD